MAGMESHSMEVDTLVATLMSLGFDIDGCQQAIAVGNSTVETAVEWLLNKDRDKSRGKALEKAKGEVVKEAVKTEPSYRTTKEDKTAAVASRYTPDETQKKAQDEFEQRQRDNIQREAKKRRLIDKQARQEVLKQIKEDRDNAKTRRFSGKQKQGEQSNVGSNDKSSIGSHEGTSSKESANNTCKLKIRLSTGKNIIESCGGSESLLDVINKIKRTYSEPDNVDIIQPFPHTKFNANDLKKSLLSLGLSPGGCIVLKRSSSTTGLEEDMPEQDEIQGNPDVAQPGIQLDITQPSREGIVSLQQEDRQRDEVQEEVEDIPQEDDVERGDDIPLPGQNVTQRQHVWGAGVSLGRHPFNPHAIDPVIHAESAAEAAEARLRARPPHPVERDEHSDSPYLPSREVPSLVDSCIKDIAARLPGHHHSVGSLAPLSQRLCFKILTCLMKKKTLTPKTLIFFVPCQLQHLVLDHYLYVTNELFNIVRLFKGLTHLSVQSCTVFTDKALEAITGLKKIVHLDFSNCTQLTNQCLKHLKYHTNLKTLKLVSTKITDEGLCPLFMETQWLELQTLNLSKTAVTNKSLVAIQAKKLKELHLEQTSVSELQGVGHLTSLTSLNVGGTRINDKSLSSLINLPSLEKLNLHQTQVTDQGLSHLTGLQLKELRLPNRINITDIGISYLQGMPLTSLDLTDYVNISDTALRTVGRLTRLERLSLSKTKISDRGMSFLSGLSRLKELDLERTAVSDDGLDVLSYFVQLEELNLSGTGITDRGISAGKLNCLRFLCKLNLSRTNLTDAGVANLNLPELTLLNIDWTMTSQHCLNLLEGCPQLKVIRRQNCRTEGR